MRAHLWTGYDTHKPVVAKPVAQPGLGTQATPLLILASARKRCEYPMRPGQDRLDSICEVGHHTTVLPSMPSNERRLLDTPLDSTDGRKLASIP